MLNAFNKDWNIEDWNVPGASSASKCAILESLALTQHLAMVLRRLEVISRIMS
jgi:hypothetical protein